MAIRGALTEAFGLEYPIVLAPMGPGSSVGGVGGGRLAAAVSNAGGLGLVGGGYGDPDERPRDERERDQRAEVVTSHAASTDSAERTERDPARTTDG